MMAACPVDLASQALKAPRQEMIAWYPRFNALSAWALLLGLCLLTNVPACLALVSMALALAAPCVLLAAGLLACPPQTSAPLAPLAPPAPKALQVLGLAMPPTAAVLLVCGSPPTPQRLHLLSVCAGLDLEQV
jgi:hypothetical protein